MLEYRPLRAHAPTPQSIAYRLRDRPLTWASVGVRAVKIACKLRPCEGLDNHCMASDASWAAAMAALHCSPCTIATSSAFARVHDTYRSSRLKSGPNPPRSYRTTTSASSPLNERAV